MMTLPDLTRDLAPPTRVPHDSGLVMAAVARVKQGDVSALHFLYVRYADEVCAYVSRMVRDAHEAEDITQNVFAKLMTAIKHYEQRDVPFAAWILRVARNVTVDHMRGRRQIPFENVRNDDAGVEQIGFERSRCLHDALSSLPAQQREVLVLRHLVGLSPREIAQRLGKTEGSVHGLHHRGRAALRELLREMDAGPVIAAARRLG
jgi:RNA polymerase sigma-70 factor (ECF subfamily)